MNKNNDTGGMGILSRKREMIRKLAGEFAENEIAPMAARIGETGEYPGELRRRIIDCGFYAIVIPKEYGGCGGNTVSTTIVTEGFTKIDASASTRLIPNSLSGGSLMMFGNEAQEQKYLRRVAEGKLVGAFAVTEPGARSDAAAITTMAETDGDYYILDGHRCFIANDSCCDLMTVFAKTDVNARGVKGINALIMKSTWEGFSKGAVENKMGIHGSSTCGLIFESMRAPKKNLLASEGQGFKICMVTLDSGRITVTTQGLGIAQGALDEAIRYIKERVQFGRPISKFQNTQSEIADMATKMECGEQLIYHTAELKDAGEPYSKNAVMARYYHGDLCNNITYRPLQLHGGHDYMKNYPIGRVFRDARLVAIHEGTSKIRRVVIANHVLGKW